MIRGVRPLLCRFLRRDTSNQRSVRCTIQFKSIQQYREQQERNRKAGAMTELVRDFVEPAFLYNGVRDILGIEFFCGVPDSLIKDFCAYVSNNTASENHVITANEGSAVALASGYHMATNKPAMVYLQNSGLGNTINPILSLAHKSVYGIPMLLLVGWRGEPGKRDEPQHLTQGQVTTNLLASLNLPFQVLPDFEDGVLETLQTAKYHLDNARSPYCLLVRKQTFKPCELIQETPNGAMSREAALECVLGGIENKSVVVGTTGMLSRELYEFRARNKQGHHRDFLTVGSMGHASMIAMGIAMKSPKTQVYCLDGDGSVIMHMGSLPVIAQCGAKNLKHVIFNNGVHDSVGGQPTAAFTEGHSMAQVAKQSGYREVFEATDEADIRSGIERLKEVDGPALLEVRCKAGHRPDLGRPTSSPRENKELLMDFLRRQ